MKEEKSDAVGDGVLVAGTSAFVVWVHELLPPL